MSIRAILSAAVMATLVMLCFAVAPAGAQASAKTAAKKLMPAAGACKGEGLTAKRKRACRAASARRRKAALARRRKAAQRKRALLRGSGAATSSPAPQVIPRPSTPEALPPSDPAPPPTPPEDPAPPTDDEPPTDDGRDCELVQGDCDIYSDLFWEMRARYERFERPWLGTGVYPAPPDCMEAAEREPVMCVTAIASLYPDGTIGLGHWVLDPESPAGWSLCIFDSEGNGPAACRY